MKKKLISVLAAVMILSFGTTAFAANSPVASNVAESVTEHTEQKAEVSGNVATKTPADYAANTTVTADLTEESYIDVKALDQATVNNAAAVTKEQLKDVINIAENFIGGTKGDALTAEAKDTSKKISAEILTAIDAVPVNLEVSAQNPVTLTFNVAGVKATDYIVVLHNNNGVWENIPCTVGDGTVTATFTSLSPIAIVKLSADTKTAGTNNDGNNNGGNTTTDTTTTTPADGTAVSPKTGAQMPVVAILAVIFAAGAIVCTKKVKFN